MKFSAKVEGLKDLDAALGELGKSAGTAVLRRVLKKAAQPIYETAKALAPERAADAPKAYFKRDGKEVERRPGTLHALVQAGTRLSRRQASAARREGKNSAEYYVGTRDRVGRLVEFGTSRTPAHPFLRPAWDQHAPDALGIIREELGGEIEKAAQRAAKKAARLARKS